MRFLVDKDGQLVSADGGRSPLASRQGYFRLQPTSPDWLLLLKQPHSGGSAQKPRVVMAGDCAGFPLQDLIAFLGQSRWSGEVRVQTPSGERTLLLKDGEVRAASSDQVADRIGEVMVRLGYLTRGQLDAVLADAPPHRIGRALVERGLVKSHDLYRCLQEQVGDIFHGMMLMKEGTFFLVDMDIEEKAQAHTLSMSMQGLLMDSIRKIDELAQFRKKIPHGGLFVTKKQASDGKLEPEEDALLAAVDGARTVAQLGQALKVSEFDATRITYRLLEGGYVGLAQSGVAAPAPVARPVASTPSKVVPVATPAQDIGRIVDVFNRIFREVRDEVAKHGKLEAFVASANAAVKSNGLSASPVLTGVAFEADGTMPAATLTSRFESLKAEGHLGSEPVMTLKQALSDVMFFLLFQAGELLESNADEDLARRVKDLLATVDVK